MITKWNHHSTVFTGQNLQYLLQEIVRDDEEKEDNQNRIFLERL